MLAHPLASLLVSTAWLLHQERKLDQKCINSLCPPLPAHFRPLHPGSLAGNVPRYLESCFSGSNPDTAKMPVRLRARRPGSRTGHGTEEGRESHSRRPGRGETAALLSCPGSLPPASGPFPRCFLSRPAVFPDPTREPRS